MRVHTIAARGLVPFPDEVLLDLDAIPGDLVAIVGEQGAGKSTLLECFPGALHPDRRCPTRGSLDALAENGGRDAFVDVTYSAAGHHYRVRQDLGRGEAHVYVDGTALALDGKVSKVGAWCAKEVLPPEVIAASCFLSQMSTGLVSADGAERRKTLLKAIGIAEIEALAERARKRRNRFTAQLDAVLATIGRLRPTAERLPALTARAVELEADLATATARHVELGAELTVARAAWEAYHEAARVRTALVDRRGDAWEALCVGRRALAAYETREVSRAQDAARRAALTAELATARGAWDTYQTAVRERQALDEKRGSARRTFDAADAAMVALAHRHAEQVELGRRADTVREDAARARDLAERLAAASGRLPVAAAEVRRREDAAGADDHLADVERARWAAANGRAKSAVERAGRREAVDAAVATLPARRITVEQAEAGEEAAREAVEARRRTISAGTAGRIDGLRGALGAVMDAETPTAAYHAAEGGIGRDDAAVLVAEAGPRELDALGTAARVARARLDEARYQLDLAERAAAWLPAVVAAEEELAAATAERDAARAAGVTAKERAEDARCRAGLARGEVDVVAALVVALEQEAAPLAGADAEERALAGVAALTAELAAQLKVAAGNDHAAWVALAALPEVTPAPVGPFPPPASLEAELSGLPLDLPPLACPDVAALEAALSALAEPGDLPIGPERAFSAIELDLAASTRDRGRLDTESALLARDVDAAGAAASELAEQDVVRGALDERVADATLLADALGISGVQALEIDACGPTLTANWNLLLHAAYGSRFTGEVSPSRPVKDKKKAKAGVVIDEAQFLVFDTQRGRKGDVSTYSGGECAHLATALFFAIALYNCTARGITEPTLFLDEPGAGLSETTVDTWLDMTRHAARLIGASKVVIIAHHPRVIEACDAVVRVIDGRLERER